MDPVLLKSVELPYLDEATKNTASAYGANCNQIAAAKKKSDLSNHDYVQYDKYQKITLALNDLKKEQLESKFFQRRQYLLDQVETSPYNGKVRFQSRSVPAILWDME